MACHTFHETVTGERVTLKHAIRGREVTDNDTLPHESVVITINLFSCNAPYWAKVIPLSVLLLSY